MQLSKKLQRNVNSIFKVVVKRFAVDHQPNFGLGFREIVVSRLTAFDKKVISNFWFYLFKLKYCQDIVIKNIVLGIMRREFS